MNITGRRIVCASSRFQSRVRIVEAARKSEADDAKKLTTSGKSM